MDQMTFNQLRKILPALKASDPVGTSGFAFYKGAYTLLTISAKGVYEAVTQFPGGKIKVGTYNSLSDVDLIHLGAPELLGQYFIRLP